MNNGLIGSFMVTATLILYRVPLDILDGHPMSILLIMIIYVKMDFCPSIKNVVNFTNRSVLEL